MEFRLTLLFTLIVFSCAGSKNGGQTNYDNPISASTGKPKLDEEIANFTAMSLNRKLETRANNLLLETDTVKQEIDFLSTSSNLSDKEAEELVKSIRERNSIEKEILDEKDRLGADNKEYLKLKKDIETEKAKDSANFSRERFAVMLSKLKTLNDRTRKSEELIESLDLRLVKVRDAVSKLTVKECRLGRIITEKVIPFDYFFELGSSDVNTDNPVLIKEFESEITSNVHDFLLICESIELIVQVTIEGYADMVPMDNDGTTCARLKKSGENCSQEELNRLLSFDRANAIKELIGLKNSERVTYLWNIKGMGQAYPTGNIQDYEVGNVPDPKRRIGKMSAILSPTSAIKTDGNRP